MTITNLEALGIAERFLCDVAANDGVPIEPDSYIAALSHEDLLQVIMATARVAALAVSTLDAHIRDFDMDGVEPPLILNRDEYSRGQMQLIVSLVRDHLDPDDQ